MGISEGNGTDNEDIKIMFNDLFMLAEVYVNAASKTTITCQIEPRE